MNLRASSAKDAWGSQNPKEGTEIAPDNGGSKKPAIWFKWILATIIALALSVIAVVTVLDYFERPTPDIENGPSESAVETTDPGPGTTGPESGRKPDEDFSPPSLSNGVQSVELATEEMFDLDTGSASRDSMQGVDLTFKACREDGLETLRASEATSWKEVGVVDFDKIKYREIRDATFEAPKDPQTGHHELFYQHMTQVPQVGHVFFVKTAEGNIGKIKITGYPVAHSDPACRNIGIDYETFPMVENPS